jgi:hypothetical protein
LVLLDASVSEVPDSSDIITVSVGGAGGFRGVANRVEIAGPKTFPTFEKVAASVQVTASRDRTTVQLVPPALHPRAYQNDPDHATSPPFPLLKMDDG